ncbi:unnamed protein product, partial [Mesorhabditis belari]|uniref:START domain-containing protein n=1 Tax=Mesorhabditis belari TaxID=2138241 RepID=A0AAF3J2Z7_9BILA
MLASADKIAPFKRAPFKRVTNEHATTGVLSVTSATTGVLSVTSATTGILPVTNATTGILPVTNEHATTGVLSVTSATTGVLSVTNATTGVLSVTSATTGVLSVTNATTGVLSVTSATTGVLSVTNATTGVLSVTSATTGILPVTNATTGILPVTNEHATTGVLSVTSATTGVLSVTSATTGILPVTNEHATCLPLKETQEYKEAFTHCREALEETALIFAESGYNVEMSGWKWNDSYKFSKKHAQLSIECDIAHYATNKKLIVDGREFICARAVYRDPTGQILFAAKSTPLKEIKEGGHGTRAHLYISAARITPHPSDSSKSFYEYVICVDMKGMMFKSVLNPVLGRLLLEDVENVRKYCDQLSKQ